MARIIGTYKSDYLVGGDAADFIAGQRGNDLLVGNGGNDILKGGIGDDTLDGGEGRDRATFAYDGGTEGVFVDLDGGYAERYSDEFGYERDSLISIEDVYGTKHDDVIYGNDQANQLWGDAGNDFLSGGGGGDVLVGGAGNDVFDLMRVMQGDTLVLDFHHGEDQIGSADPSLFDTNRDEVIDENDDYTHLEVVSSSGVSRNSLVITGVADPNDPNPPPAPTVTLYGVTQLDYSDFQLFV